MNMKIALIGYGSMGKAVHEIAKNENIEVSNIFEIDSPINENEQYEFDIAIDFSLPRSAVDNALKCNKLGKSIVVGTTGWYEEINKLKEAYSKGSAAMLWASNFSVGMQMFMRIIRYASNLAEKFDDYDIMLHEMHHKRKKDSPSGSAVSLANIILDEISRKDEIFTETSHDLIDPQKLHISSTRGGEITGLHTVYIDSGADSLELTHRAKNRTGFARGAVEAAKWLYGKSGFYSIEDMLKDIWK